MQGAVWDMDPGTVLAHLALVSVVAIAEHELHHHCLHRFTEVFLGAADLVWIVEGNVAVGGARCAATSASASGHLFEGTPTVANLCLFINTRNKYPI